MIKKGFSILGVGLLFLISLLPFFVLYLIADVLFVLIYYITRYRRKVVQENLANAFPEKSVAERQAIERKYFRYLADLIVETIKLYTISESEVRKRFVINYFNETTAPAFSQGRSVVAAVGHYCNWEMGNAAYSLCTTEHKRITVYKPLSNQQFDEMFNHIRSRFGATLIPMKGIFRKLVEYRKEPTITMLAGDQTPAYNEAQHFVNFLNQPTAVFLGVEKMAKSFDCAVVFCDTKRVKRGYYNCNFELLFSNAKDTTDLEITNAHVQRLERAIREEPQYWLWSHRRWKFKPNDFNR